MAQLLIVASDRYDLERLKLICEDKLAGRICKDNVVATLMLAARHNCQNLQNICLNYIPSVENLHSVIETYVSELSRRT
jgi:speckle-type POZ protein